MCLGHWLLTISDLTVGMEAHDAQHQLLHDRIGTRPMKVRFDQDNLPVIQVREPNRSYRRGLMYLRKSIVVSLVCQADPCKPHANSQSLHGRFPVMRQ